VSQLLAAVRRDAPQTDEQLVAELARGRPEALGAIYTRYAGLIFSVAAQSVGPTAAEEIVQETFLAIWRGAGTFDPAQGAFRPWVLRVVHWRVLNELRRRRRHPDPEPEQEPLLAVPDHEPSPEEQVWHGERAHLVQAALSALSAKQRQAVALAFMEDLTHEQVADVLGVPLGTAKTRIRDGLLHLRAALMPIAASLVVVFALSAGVLRWLDQEHQVRQSERAIGVLTSSDARSIRVESVTGAETHATYRVVPGVDLAVLSLSHAPAGTYAAWAHLDGRWVSLGTFEPDLDGHGVLIAEGAAFAQQPDAIEVTLDKQVVLDWHAP
jgi:RNA polymerase sigma-70 factor (ECF subfamily)